MPTRKPKSKPRPVVTYSRDAVVDVRQLAAGLGVSVEIAKKMDLPFAAVGQRERFVWGQVLDTLMERATAKGRRMRITA